MKNFSILVPLLLLCAAFSGCKKDESHLNSNIVISMKDAPAAFSEVNVEVIDIEVHCDESGWVQVPLTDSIYNLLALQGNNAAYLTNAVLPAEKISQIRLILGTHNSVVIGANTYQLLFSSEDETGLKVNIQKNLVGGVTYDLLIDFDANQSIIDEGNGSYRLKPVVTAEFI
jgi:hypothetical protein